MNEVSNTNSWQGLEDPSGIHEQAFLLWTRMRPQIRKLAMKVVQFSNLNTLEDYENGIAYEACLQACIYYNAFRKRGLVAQAQEPETIQEKLQELRELQQNMKLETYAYWYLLKAFHKAAGTNEVSYIVVSPDGNTTRYATNDFHKRFPEKTRKELSAQGYIFLSEKIVKTFSELANPDATSDFDVADSYYFSTEDQAKYPQRIRWANE